MALTSADSVPVVKVQVAATNFKLQTAPLARAPLTAFFRAPTTRTTNAPGMSGLQSEGAADTLGVHVTDVSPELPPESAHSFASGAPCTEKGQGTVGQARHGVSATLATRADKERSCVEWIEWEDGGLEPAKNRASSEAQDDAIPVARHVAHGAQCVATGSESVVDARIGSGVVRRGGGEEGPNHTSVTVARQSSKRLDAVHAAKRPRRGSSPEKDGEIDQRWGRRGPDQASVTAAGPESGSAAPGTRCNDQHRQVPARSVGVAAEFDVRAVLSAFEVGAVSCKELTVLARALHRSYSCSYVYR